MSTITTDPEILEYVSADGLRVTLAVERGTTGRLMPPVDIWEDTVPLMAGSRYRGARHGARTIVLPIVTGGLRYGRDELRALARVLDPMRGMGSLRQIVVSGGVFNRARLINCVYEAGLDSFREDYPHFGRAALMFRCPDPYWTDADELVRDFTPSNIETEWFPFFPLDLAGTNIRGEFSITNTGDADAWPSVEVGGPGRDFEFHNLTTGQYMRVAGEVPAGRQLRIVTQPGARAVMLNADNWFGRLDRASTLWGLAPGFNLLRVLYVTESSRVGVRWRLRYLTP